MIYVKSTIENLRDAPNGDKLGTLDKGAEMIVLEDASKWVKVRVEGWIWKDSVTDSKLGLAGDKYRAMQIIVKELSTAEDILKRLKAGEDFKELATAKSIGPAAKRGGDLGFFSKGDFKPEIENAILNLKPGEISDIIKSNIGYHIFKRIQ
ncbi:MAG: peptidylprolyl isomerase [bacterium]